jgi:hypothetical protein
VPPPQTTACAYLARRVLIWRVHYFEDEEGTRVGPPL